MKNTSFKAGMAVFILSVFSFQAAAERYRDIAAYTLSVRGGEKVHIYENAFIAAVSPAASAVARLYYDKRALWSNTIVTLGPVIKFNRLYYAEITYGYGKNSLGNRSDYFSADLNREVPRYRAGLVLRHVAMRNYYYNLLITSLDYHFPAGLTAMGKCSLSKDSEKNLDSSVVVEAEYLFSRRMAARAGYTTGGRLYDAQYAGGGGGSFYSVLAGLNAYFSEKTSIRYILEAVHFRGSAEVENKQTVLCDIRF